MYQDDQAAPSGNEPATWGEDMEITEKSYFEERLNNQINWYSTKSQKSQKKYKVFKGIQIALSASIPILVGFIVEFEFIATVVGIFGVIITAIEGWLALGKHHENWIEYRRICETLKHEKYMYLTRTGVYQVDFPFNFLVERVESIISNENVNWANLNKNTTEET